MEDSSRDSNRFQFERFILTQLLVMALKGVPAFYLPALLASENDIKSFSMTGQRRDLNREKFKSENLLAVLNNPESNANKNLKYLRNAMDVRSELKQFHPCSQMKCLSKGRSDIVVIKRGKGPESVYAIHNMTENKINYQLNDNDLPKLIDNDLKRKIINEHIDWIKKLKKKGINIKSGFLIDELKRPGDGGLLILEMNNYKNALKIIKNDPMIKNNLVEWKLNEWVDSNK